MSRDANKCAVFILSHGRPDSVITVKALRKSGYTGRIYIVIDNEDDRADEYFALYGKDVIQFDKERAARTVDTADISGRRNAVVFARNAVYEIARDLGLDYFLVLDDDYKDFLYRYLDRGVYSSNMIHSIDAVFAALITFMEDTGAATVAFSQGGDHMGVDPKRLARGLLRKAMNLFVFRTDRPVPFYGLINEDVNTYVVEGSRGVLFFTIMGLQLNQIYTQQADGGLTAIYLDVGTYVKSFYSVMMAPSCVTIRYMGRTHRRIHHSVKWDHAVPKILSDRYRKAGG